MARPSVEVTAMIWVVLTLLGVPLRAIAVAVPAPVVGNRPHAPVGDGR